MNLRKKLSSLLHGTRKILSVGKLLLYVGVAYLITSLFSSTSIDKTDVVIGIVVILVLYGLVLWGIIYLSPIQTPAPAPAQAPTQGVLWKWTKKVAGFALAFAVVWLAWHWYQSEQSSGITYQGNNTWRVMIDKDHVDSNGWSDRLAIPRIGGTFHMSFVDGQVHTERDGGDRFYLTSSKDSVEITKDLGHCDRLWQEAELNTGFKFKQITPDVLFVDVRFEYPTKKITTRESPKQIKNNVQVKESKPVKIFVIDFKKNKTSTSCAQKDHAKKIKWSTEKETTPEPHQKWGTVKDGASVDDVIVN